MKVVVVARQSAAACPDPGSDTATAPAAWDVGSAYFPPASSAQMERIASSSPSPSGTASLGALA